MAQDIICPYCHQPTSADATFCGNCGRQLSNPTKTTNTPTNPPAPQPNQVAASNDAFQKATTPANSPVIEHSSTASNPPLTASPTSTPVPVVAKDTFFKLPRLPRFISVTIVIIFGLLTLIFFQSIFRAEKIWGEQDTQGLTREEYIDSMRVMGLITTTISFTITIFGVACFRHPKVKK